MDIQTRPDPVTRARELGAEIAAAGDEIELSRRIPEALLGRLHDSRLFRMLLPRSAGGDQTEPAVYMAAVEELALHDASIAWNVFVANSSALIAAYLEPAVNHAIFADPSSILAWGPPNASCATAVVGGYRVTGQWDFASGCRQAHWMGAHCHVLEAHGALRLNRFGRPTVRTLLFPASEATLLDTWRTIGLRGTASDSYCVNDVFVSESFSSTREDPTLRRERGPLYAFTMPGLYAAGVAGVAFGIARAMLSEFITLASRKAPRGLTRLADNAVVQADVARAEARLGSARAYLVETLTTIYEHADDVAPIEVADRARVRLACTNAIQGAAEVADFAYKGAGVDAIFPSSPFERRFRDMHTLSQQIQARAAHFESVGRSCSVNRPRCSFRVLERDSGWRKMVHSQNPPRRLASQPPKRSQILSKPQPAETKPPETQSDSILPCCLIGATPAPLLVLIPPEISISRAAPPWLDA